MMSSPTPFIVLGVQCSLVHTYVYKMSSPTLLYGLVVQRSVVPCSPCSGESGAGKTESTKFILGYLSAMSQKAVGPKHSDIYVESAILESRCVCLCFGCWNSWLNFHFLRCISISSPTLFSSPPILPSFLPSSPLLLPSSPLLLPSLSSTSPPSFLSSSPPFLPSSPLSLLYLPSPPLLSSSPPLFSSSSLLPSPPPPLYPALSWKHSAMLRPCTTTTRAVLGSSFVSILHRQETLLEEGLVTVSSFGIWRREGGMEGGGEGRERGRGRRERGRREGEGRREREGRRYEGVVIPVSSYS